MKRAFIAGVMSWLFVQEVSASALHYFWIPRAMAPEKKECRFEVENMVTPNKKRRDPLAGQHETVFSVGCNDLSFGAFDIEMGLDYREASDMTPRHFADPLQGYAQLTYGQRLQQGFRASLGVDHVGLQQGVNNDNRLSLVTQYKVGDWEVALGGFMGNHKTMVDRTGSTQATGALLGFWHYIGRGLVGLEWMSGKSRYGYGFLGSQIKFNDMFTGTLGYGIANDRKNMRDWFLIRITLQ